ncbi:hypothetical protein [Polycladidibacter hongkongensis]|nr:hypothetical protein [Pseudovibrio hongkongensis]
MPRRRARELEAFALLARTYALSMKEFEQLSLSEIKALLKSIDK